MDLTVTLHEQFMRLALKEAHLAYTQGEVPIGAILIDEQDEVLGKGHNQRELWRSPLAHAEMIAIEEAARRKGGWRLQGCTLYVTVEPCVMCAGAVQLSRIDRLVFGAANPKGGAIVSSLALYDIPTMNHYPLITTGILADECGMMMQDFFRSRRRDRHDN